VKKATTLAVIAVLILGFGQGAFGVGAVTPFTSYEAEAGTLGGGATIVSLTAPPTTAYSSPELEASGHAYVALNAMGQSVLWTNNTSQSVTAINLRSCIPDAPAGGGITSTIDLYVDGAFRQAFSVNSLQNYCYEGTNYNGQTDKNPADGDPRGFWNDTHAFITGNPVAPGHTISFQMDAANTAAFYYIDVVDLEAPSTALAQPSNSLSIVTYGAVSNDISVDNTSAINNCFRAAKSQGETAFIPPGTYYFSADKGGLNASGITITGAGPWYSTLYRVTPAGNTQGVANIITTTSCTISNLSLDCNAPSRAGNLNNGAVNSSGTNWVVDDVWIQHVTSAFWCAGVNGIARNCRVLSTWADGGNFNNVQSADGIGMNLTYSNQFVRGTGDDAMAINSVNTNGNTHYTIMSNITYVNNTALCSWGGKCMGLYGGINDVVTNNLLCDSPRYMGLGVMRFGVNGSDLLSATVTGNTLLRCGGNGYNQQQQAMMIGNGGDGQGVGIVANAYVGSNTIIDAMYDGIGFSTSSNIVLQRNIITSPGLDAIAIGAPDLGSGVVGAAIINSNTVTGLNTGHYVLTNSAILYGAIIPTQASSYNSVSEAQTENCAEGGLDLGSVQNGSYAEYNNLNLTGVDAFVARVAGAGAGGTIQIYLDSSTGTLIGSCPAPVTGGGQIWTNVYCGVSAASGNHNVYLVFAGGAGNLFSVEFFSLYAATPALSHQLVPGSTYSLKSLANNLYVTAASSATSLIAQGATVGAAQEFTVVDAGGGNIGFLALSDGDDVTADNAGSSPLIANRASVGPWETFTEVDAGNGNIGLLAGANGKFVTAPNNGASALIATGISVAPPQSFTPAIVYLVPPAAPAGLTASPGNSQVSLSWAAVSDASGYNVKSSATNGGPYTIIASNLAASSYTNTGLNNGTIYYYVVSAINMAGQSTNSPQVAVAPELNLAVQIEGDLIVNLQATDLNSSGAIWTNRTSNPYSVGNFTTLGGGLLNVVAVPWNGHTVNTLFVNSIGNNSVQSALASPAEINADSPVSVEAWVKPVSVSPKRAIVNYGYQGGSGSPVEDREFSFDSGGSGVISGDFGNLDTGWTTPPNTNVWHYLAYTWNGSTLTAYLDGVQNVQRNVGAICKTVQTFMQIGSGIGGTGVNGGNDVADDYIACARVESGVLTAGDVAANFAVGPLGTPVAATPAGLAAVAGDSQVVLTWNPSSNATTYNIRSSTNSGGPYSLIAAGLTALSFTNTGLANGTTYYFVVTATNSAGESASTLAVNAQPVSLAAPQLSFGVGDGQIQLNWPQDHSSWILQMQSNAPGAGLGTNWAIVPNSGVTNLITLPIYPTGGSVFYRLVSP
jgi:hypothetical protein